MLTHDYMIRLIILMRPLTYCEFGFSREKCFMHEGERLWRTEHCVFVSAACIIVSVEGGLWYLCKSCGMYGLFFELNSLKFENIF